MTQPDDTVENLILLSKTLVRLLEQQTANRIAQQKLNRMLREELTASKQMIEELEDDVMRLRQRLNFWGRLDERG